jgi:hypothetical protein
MVARAAAFRVVLALTATLGVACLVAVVVRSAPAAVPGSGFKLYSIHLVVRGQGYAHAKGVQPIDAENGGIDTASGEASSKFYAETDLKIRIDPKTAKVGFPYPKPGYASVPLDREYSKVSGSWDGIVGDATDAKGGYSCAYSAPVSAFRGLTMVFTFAGVPVHGTVPISFGLNQPQRFAPGNPKVSCSGYQSDHGFPGQGTLGEGAFMSLVGSRAGPPTAKLSVKKLLGTLKTPGYVLEVPRLVDTGSCDGCPLPMRAPDGSQLIIYASADLSASKP